MPTRPPGTPDVDLTFDGASGTVNGGVFMTGQFQQVPDQFSSFLAIRHNGTEEGYNTNGTLQFNEKDVQNSTHAVLLANVPIVVGDGSHGTVEGVAYREFRLNIAEAGTDKQYLSLDALQIWQEESGGLTGFTPGSGFTGAHSNYLAYNLDTGSDHWAALLEPSNGNGANQTEFTILIPDSDFINDPAHRYVTLYSKLGVQTGWEADSGSEQWGLSVNSANPTPAMTVHKTASVPGGTANHAGEVISYDITVANVGDVDLTGITVTDTRVNNLAPVLSSGFNIGDTNHDGKLSTGETWDYTASYTVTQNDLNTLGNGTGLIQNTVMATSAQTTTPVSASTSVVVESGASVDLTKTADVTSVHAAGDVIHYTINLLNDGNVTVTNPVVQDDQVNIVTPILDFNAPVLGPPLIGPVLVGDYNIGDTNQNGFQDPGETFQFQIVGDENNNGIQEASETWFFTNIGDTNRTGSQDPGETFQYYNAGDTNHDGVQNFGETFQFNVDHTATPILLGGFNAGDMNHNGSLDVGETWQYSVAYTVTQADIDNGGVVDPALTHNNTATVTTGNTAPDSASAAVAVVQDPRVAVTKSAVVGDGAADMAGDVIHYTISVANAGNMTLTGVNVTDPSASNPTLASGDTDGDGKLDVGETWVYTASHIVTQAEIDNGGVLDPALTYNNTASVTTAQGAADSDANGSASASVPIVQNPHVTLHKLAWVADGTADAAGDVINYAISTTNDGNMTLTASSVIDPSVSNLVPILVGGFNAGDIDHDGKLSVGETWHYSANHTVTQADIDNGGVVDPALAYNNTASVTTAEGASGSESASVPIVQNPDFTVAKAADVASVDAAGDLINYTVTVKNTGNMTLTGVTVSDPLVTNLAFASGDTNGDGKLDLSETWTYTGSHTVTQAEMDAGGSIGNTATADTVQTAPEIASASVTVQQNPAVMLEKAGTFGDDNNDGYAEVGEHIHYTFAITNIGNVTLHNVSISDADAGVSVSGSAIAALGPGSSDSATWTASYAITQADIDNGSFLNTASVAATEASATDSATVTLPPAPPATTGILIDDNANLSHLVDPGGDGASVGDLIQFSFEITNLGSTTLTNVMVSDTLGDVTTSGNIQSPVPPTLAGNAVFPDTFNHHITAADLAAHHVIDDITVTALDPSSTVQTSTWHYDFMV
jgi:uncharacterized repeat protein (TIGR01451 family)